MSAIDDHEARLARLERIAVREITAQAQVLPEDYAEIVALMPLPELLWDANGGQVGNRRRSAGRHK